MLSRLKKFLAPLRAARTSSHSGSIRALTPAHTRIINREPVLVPVGARIPLPDGSWLPATERRLARYFRAEADLATPSLNALDTRSPSYLNVISYLVDVGRTPATSMDVQEAFVAIHGRVPGPIELDIIRTQLKQFGFLAD